MDQDDSEEAPGLVDEDNDSDTEEDAFGQLRPDYFQPEEDRIYNGLYDNNPPARPCPGTT